MSFRRACVIGHPVAHSRSPLIHHHWLAEHRIDGDYVREDVSPEKIWLHYEEMRPQDVWTGGRWVTQP